MRSATRCVALSRAPALPTHALGGGLEHTLEPLPRLDGQLSAARRESRTELLETDRQVVQSGERRLALRQALEGEVERFAVVHRDQVIADAPHVVASRAEVAEGEEVAVRFRHL